jgi:spermidine synthase
MRGAPRSDLLKTGRLLESFRTPYQEVAVYDTAEFGRLYTLDSSLMASERDEFFYHENLVHPAAVSHPAPRSALIVGGGDGGSAEELLKHPSIEKVTLVELDAGVVEVAIKYLDAVHHGVFEDPRLDLHIADGLAYVRATREQYDLIVLDLTDPGGPSAPLYTVAFFAACRQRLAPGGAMTLHLGPLWEEPQRCRDIVNALNGAFPLVRPYQLFIPLYGTLWGMACASDHLDPLALSAAEVDNRLARRGISGLRYYHGDTHRAVLALPNFARELLA